MRINHPRCGRYRFDGSSKSARIQRQDLESVREKVLPNSIMHTTTGLVYFLSVKLESIALQSVNRETLLRKFCKPQEAADMFRRELELPLWGIYSGALYTETPGSEKHWRCENLRGFRLSSSINFTKGVGVLRKFLQIVPCALLINRSIDCGAVRKPHLRTIASSLLGTSSRERESSA
ncbi:hypothetical protein RB195_013771 [Necator americanus]|uniref:Uncharacterized protein n=1 Tax=Necator americanus TaxID=51031 RepID=A0ABR1DX95_NECAM